MKFVKPKVFLVGETRIIEQGLQDYLEHVGATKWKTDAPSDSEKLAEVMGRLCYRSFEPGMNPNVTRVREGNATYLSNIINVGHGSVVEHPVLNFIFSDVSRVVTHELVRHRAGTAMSLMGYVDIENVLHRGTPELVDATVKEAIEVGAADDRFVLSSSDGILTQTPIENLRAYFAAAKKYGMRG